MTRLFRTTALLTAIALASGCTGPRRFDRRMGGDVRLPSAPVLEPSPKAVDPDKIGTVGSPSPAAPNGVPMSPPQNPFGE